MSGAATPKRRSISRMTEVWSYTCESTQPPRLHGEITYSGTRGPSPYGRPRSSAASYFSSPGAGWRWYSPSVLTEDAPAQPPSTGEGGAGGGMWSKKPSFSSNISSRAVRLQTSGSAVSASSTRAV
jgi:hypothetical protein